MTWTRLSDDFPDRPELLKISRSARLLHVEALVWCNRVLTDGMLPGAALPRLTDADDVQEDVRQLVDVGLWEEADNAWQIDWTGQERAADVKARQEYQAEKQRNYRDRRDRHTRGDHSRCDPRFCKKGVTGNATSNTTSDVTGGVTNSRPGPSRPVPAGGKGQGRMRGTHCPTNAIIATDGSCCDDCDRARLDSSTTAVRVSDEETAASKRRVAS